MWLARLVNHTLTPQLWCDAGYWANGKPWLRGSLARALTTQYCIIGTHVRAMGVGDQPCELSSRDASCVLLVSLVRMLQRASSLSAGFAWIWRF
jgi:hypothetical protein